MQNLKLVKEVGERYDNEGSARRFYSGEFNNSHRAQRLKKEFDFVKSLDIKGETVLDIGCSGGKYSHLLAENNVVYGIDLSREALKFAKAQSPNVNFVQASATHLPFKKGFTCVLFIELMHHLDNGLLKSAMSELSRVITSKGKVICDLRNSLNPVMWYSYKRRDGRYFPLKTRSLFWLIDNLKAWGFSVTSKTGLFFPISTFAPYVMCVAIKDRQGVT